MYMYIINVSIVEILRELEYQSYTVCMYLQIYLLHSIRNKGRNKAYSILFYTSRHNCREIAIYAW